MVNGPAGLELNALGEAGRFNRDDVFTDGDCLDAIMIIFDWIYVFE